MKRVVFFFFVAVAAAALWALGGAALAADTFILQAEDYKATGAGFGFYDADTGNSGGQYRTNTGEDVDIEVAYDGGVAVGYNVGWTNTDEWFKLTTDPGTWITDPVFAEGKRYLVRAHKAGYGGSFRIDIDGVAATAPITYLATGGWQTWNDSYWALTKSPITAGSHEVTFYITGGGFNVDYLEFKSTDIAYSAPITQKLDPRTGFYYERVGSQTWDQSRYDLTQNPRTFQGVAGTFAMPDGKVESQGMASLGQSWIALTDSTGVSDLDFFNPQATLGTDEGGDESALSYPAEGLEPVYGERGYGWKRLDGNPLTFQYWNSGEPNDSGGAEDAAQLYDNGQWNDHVAGGTIGQSDYSLPYLVKYATTLDQGKFQILERKSTGTVTTIAEAEALLALPSGDAGILSEATGEAYAVSFQDPDSGGGNTNFVRAPFLSNTELTDDNHFALKATGQIEIPEAGAWTFAVVHDDYTKLTIDGNVVSATSQVDTDLLCIDFATAGVKSLELIFQEQEGGAYVQLFAAQGEDIAFDPDIFRLIGDEFGGGLAVVAGEAPHAGDANKDGKVDDLDASILAANWQRSGDATWATADFNGDGNVNDLDASILAANWQYGVGSAVPEPGTLVLLAGALAAALLVRRRK